jgi:hypothetical protein
MVWSHNRDEPHLLPVQCMSLGQPAMLLQGSQLKADFRVCRVLRRHKSECWYHAGCLWVTRLSRGACCRGALGIYEHLPPPCHVLLGLAFPWTQGGFLSTWHWLLCSPVFCTQLQFASTQLLASWDVTSYAVCASVLFAGPCVTCI